MDSLQDRPWSHAMPFLACLLGCSPEEAGGRPLTFQTFDDEKPGGKARQGLARVLHGTLHEHAPALQRLNQAGAGVFVTINATDLKGRKKENVQALRAWWADLDEKDAAEPLDLSRVPLQPSMMVRTPGGSHLYWVSTEPLPCKTPERREEHEAELRGIVASLAPFGADRKVADVARVLRVPGFLHRKAEPCMVDLSHTGGARVTRDQVRAAFLCTQSESQQARGLDGSAPPHEENSVHPAGGRDLIPSPMERIPNPTLPGNRPGNWRERVAAYLRTCPPSIQGQDGSGSIFNVFLKVFTMFDLDEAEAVDLVAEHFNVPGRCEPPWSLVELEHKAADANRSAGASRGQAWQASPTQGREHVGHGTGEPAPGPTSTEPQPGPGGDRQDRPTVPGFEWGPRGLYQMKGTGKDEEGNQREPEKTWIAPPFTLPGLVRDEDSRGWRLLISWEDLDRVPHEEAIPWELLSGEAAEISRILAQGGMALPPDIGPRKALLRYLCGARFKVSRRIRLVDTLGWQEGAFILPSGEAIGNPSETVRYSGEAAGRRAHATRGNLEGWKDGVARFAVGNPRLAFALACAFAGPLLDVLRPDGGGGFNLMGASSRGKSTCLECAASVWGRPDPLPTWRATSNGLEGIAGSRNDGFLVLDELSQVDPKEAGAVAYMLANGTAKARAMKDGSARTVKQWRLVFLSSGELGLEDKLGEDGKRSRAGQEVRVPDVPCPQEGMFQDPHSLPSLGSLAEHLKAQARAHYGHPARVFLENLAGEWSRRDHLKGRLREMESAWLAQALPPGSDAQVRRVAGRFALVAVAGELARAMGILPWPTGEAEKAAQECFRAWLDRRGHSGASEVHRGIQTVLDFLDRNGQSRFAPWGMKDCLIVNRAGFKKQADAPSEGWDYFINSSAWAEVCQGFSSAGVAKACMEAGILEPGREGRSARAVTIPGQGKTRCYVIRAAGVARYLGYAEEVP